MANIMSMTKLQNKPSRGGFDLSTRKGFTANAGEILPVKIWDIIPGDDLVIDLSSFTRTAPIQTAAFTRIKEYYDFYFVPANLLWNQFNTMITQMGANRQQVSDINLPVFAQNNQLPTFTLFQLLDIYGEFKAMPDTNASSKDMMGVSKAHSMRKLCWYLGYGDLEYYFENGYVVGSADNINLFDNPRLNPFPWLAYNKVYSDHFRNTQWEKSDPFSFNINYVNGTSTQFSLDPLKNNSGFFGIRYSNWEKDLFMGLLPQSQFGNTATVDLSSLLNPTTANISLISSQSQGGVPLQTGSSYGAGTLVAAGGNPSFSLNSTAVQGIASAIGLTQQSLQSAFSVLALRKAEAEQKFREITQSVHQDYKSQVDAHWDEKVSDAYSDMSRRIGGFDASMDISEVVNQNLTDGNTADIQGKGVNAMQGKIVFKNNGLYGWLVCVYHAQPRLDYAFRSRLSKQITRTNVTDYAIPEFDKIGMDSVLRQELANDKSLVNSPILGYAPRYYDYKTDIDEIVGAFVEGGLTDWVAPLSEDYLKEYLKNNTWSYPIMKVNPDILNPIFTFDAGKTDFTQEQFRTLCYMDVKAVRKLDRDGLPY